ncbi:MAG TPA: hypothetical protein VHO72_09955, partial [Bacteroidales bacterium]|nr:hypothetical protein [Bacteroidales bacterium]
KDTSLMGYFNREFLGGKWIHFQDQPHLGYMSWRDPPVNSLRAIKLNHLIIPDTVIMSVSVEESESVWPTETRAATLPQFNIFSQRKHYFEIFNQGGDPFDYTITTDQPWIILSQTSGTIEKEERIYANIDWSKVTKGLSTGNITINGPDSQVSIKVEAFNPKEISKETLRGFVETNGYVSIEAEHYSKKHK